MEVKEKGLVEGGGVVVVNGISVVSLNKIRFGHKNYHEWNK